LHHPHKPVDVCPVNLLQGNTLLKETSMKFGNSIAIVAVLASGLSLSAFAKDKNETKVTLTDTVQVGSTEVKPGDYKLQWDGNGPDVQVKVVKGKDVVATVPAKLTENKTSLGTNAVTTGVSGNAKTLNQVDFAGGKQSLVFIDASATQAANGQQ
jgi:hypothetical protein